MGCRQLIVSLAGLVNSLLAIQRYSADGVDLCDHSIRRVLVGLIGHQLGIGRLSRSQGRIVADLGLLRCRQLIVSRTGLVDGALAVQRHGADGVDQCLHRLDGGSLQLRDALSQCRDLGGLREGQVVLLLRGQRIVGILRRLDGIALRQRHLARLGQGVDLGLCVVDGLELGDGGFHLLQLRGIDLALLGLVQILIRLAGHICGIAVLLVVVVAHIGSSGQRVDQPVHIGRARTGVDNVQHIPCTGVVAGLRLLLVHAGPCVLAAAHIDGVARRNGDHLRPLEEAAALLIGGDLLVQEDLRQIVLVGGGGRQLQVGALAVDGQRVLVGITGLAGGEPGQQLAALDVQRRKGGVGVAPCTAHIGAQALAAIHDADHVAVAQRAVLHGELLEAEVGEPVVQRAHPAGVVAAVHLGQSLDRGDIAILRAGLGEAVLLQRRHDAVHHGAVGVQVDPLIHQLAVPRCAVLHGVGGVLHDDLHLAVVGGLTHGHHGGLIRLLHFSGGTGGLNGLYARVIGGLYAVAGQAVLHGVQAGDGSVLRGLRVAADRCPCDNYGHIIEARGHLQERVGNHLIALGGEASPVAAGVVERGVPAGGVRLQTADRDALDSVLSAVDRIGHVAQHAGGVAAVFIRHIHGHAGVGNAPARAGDDAGAVLFARADGRIAAQEVRGIVGIHAGHDVLRQGRGLGDPGISRAVVGIAGGVEGE